MSLQWIDSIQSVIFIADRWCVVAEWQCKRNQSHFPRGLAFSVQQSVVCLRSNCALEKSIKIGENLQGGVGIGGHWRKSLGMRFVMEKHYKWGWVHYGSVEISWKMITVRWVNCILVWVLIDWWDMSKLEGWVLWLTVIDDEWWGNCGWLEKWITVIWSSSGWFSLQFWVVRDWMV